MLSPWPKNDETITRTIVLNEEYFRELVDDRRRALRESVTFKALVVLYPFLGFLWSPQKRALNQAGFESHAISSMSVYVGFTIGLLGGVLLVLLAFPMFLLLGVALIMVDAIIRFDRLLTEKDQIPPGFYEWLIRRKDSYE